VRIQKIAPAALGLMAFVAMASPGCSCGGETDGSSSDSTTSTNASSSSAGAGGSGGAGGAGGAGGGGQGGGSADNGHSATETVSAGEVSKSSSYQMVFTLGQPTQNQGTTTSSSYRLKGGLVGANGSSQ
jgi:hypothetical protein